MKRILIFFFLLSISSCQIYNNDTVNNMPSIIQWSTKNWSSFGEKDWLIEARKRFPNPVVFICHGGYMVMPIQTDKGFESEFTWSCFPDPPGVILPMEDVAWTLHNLYPNRDVILVSCNSKGSDLYVPRVYYAKNLVYQIPENSPLFAANEESKKDHWVGNIWEFVTYLP